MSFPMSILMEAHTTCRSKSVPKRFRGILEEFDAVATLVMWEHNIRSSPGPYNTRLEVLSIYF